MRVVIIKGDPWFVAADVCRVLDLSLVNGGATRYLNRLDKEERCVIKRNDAERMSLSLFAAHDKAPCLTIISESGLYKLVLRSDKPEAKPFQDWVTKVVLPAIRKDGGYVMGEGLVDYLRW